MAINGPLGVDDLASGIGTVGFSSIYIFSVYIELVVY